MKKLINSAHIHMLSSTNAMSQYSLTPHFHFTLIMVYIGNRNCMNLITKFWYISGQKKFTIWELAPVSIYLHQHAIKGLSVCHIDNTFFFSHFTYGYLLTMAEPWGLGTTKRLILSTICTIKKVKFCVHCLSSSSDFTGGRIHPGKSHIELPVDWLVHS